MTDRSSADILASFWRPWFWLAPQELWQSINSGWSFGNVTINEQNSSSPQTEQAILAEESYGRQIGKLLDAVSELIKDRPDKDRNQAYRDVAALKDKVDKLKHAAVLKRIDQLGRDLELLRRSDKPDDRDYYKKGRKALLTLLEPGGG